MCAGEQSVRYCHRKGTSLGKFNSTKNWTLFVKSNGQQSATSAQFQEQNYIEYDTIQEKIFSCSNSEVLKKSGYFALGDLNNWGQIKTHQN